MNYFGFIQIEKNPTQKISIEPLLFVKNDIKVAIYGVGPIRGKSNGLMFKDHLITFIPPSKVKLKTNQKTNDKDWFKILALHETNVHNLGKNKIKLSTGKLIDVDTFFNLVVTGDLHECKLKQSTPFDKNFRIIQPGSSIPTKITKEEEEKYISFFFFFKKIFNNFFKKILSHFGVE